MTRVYQGDKIVPVTIVDVKDCILAKKESEGFELGLGKKKKPNKAIEGKYSEIKKVPQYRKYFKGSLNEEINIGDPITIEMFDENEHVIVNGISKGKGFAGVVKRWGFAGGPRTHGQSDRLRAPGSIGAGTDPGRVLKGKKMSGRMGRDKITIKSKQIVGKEGDLMLISGPVPGSNGDLIAIYTE